MGALAGRRVMIVEDNFLIAEIIADTISTNGGEPVGPFTLVGDAMQFLHEGGQMDVAILDVNLDRQSFEIAALLHVLRIPYVFVTGHSADIPVEFRGAALCCKPFTPASLLIAVRSALAAEGGERRRA